MFLFGGYPASIGSRNIESGDSKVRRVRKKNSDESH